MRILHVLSANFFAGSVAYAVALAEAHHRAGHQVWLASDAAALPTVAAQVQLPISQRKYGQRLRNIRALRQLVKTYNIDVVHAHSRAASWVSYFALKGLKVPLVSTAHGRQHLHASTSLFDVYGQKVIAICENLAQHLREEVKMSPTKIVVVPNGIAFEKEELKIKKEELKINNAEHAKAPTAVFTSLRVAFIGRFNGPKGERAAALLQHVFPALLQEFAQLRVALIGGELEQLPAAGKAVLVQLQSQYGERVEVVGFTDDVTGWLRKIDLVIGAGRVVMEALGEGRAALALGEALYAGPVTLANYAEAAASNFGDILSRLQPGAGFDPALLLANAQAFLRQPYRIAPALQQRVRHDYDLVRVAARVLAVYESARMALAVPDFMPVLMYHKIPDAAIATKHQIFVTKEHFTKHLAYFKSHAISPITFQDYQDFASGRRPLAEFPRRPIVLTFDDGYLDNYTNLLPLMQQYGYRGVMYLLGDFEVRYNQWDLATDPTEPRAELMDTAQKQAFVAAGWEIGAHTQTHAHLTQLPPAEAAAEIAASKAALEQRLGTEISSFAYPYGDLDATTKALVAEAGFRFAVATDTGGLHLEDDRMQIFRINIFPHETASSLFKKTSSWYRRYYRWKRKK
ncbi:polysaccharide deacetylase family protein [Hymenobacter sp. H14-R3]|uniref:polysaccharide deacetylase family protein n=1 Tax=Hymenobacter sp. H14-R3 TaxID=3046308 RepID=UPI0024B8A3AE|nr:polysaccharide deacetylase family protein [Hymenobacter sp. H14-R3]MDJ0365121.1 polysaccharide deacetylase family protein [Hymenobacter sp. H14-R3]